MKVKFKMTSDGEVAIVPRAEYERLRDLAREAEEDIGTARLVARAKKGNRRRRSRAADGDRRSSRQTARTRFECCGSFVNLTQDELATAVGITQNYLSDLETGKRKGPLALHRKFAEALGVPLELLSTIAVSEQEADPARFAKRRQVIADMKRSRGQR